MQFWSNRGGLIVLIISRLFPALLVNAQERAPVVVERLDDVIVFICIAINWTFTFLIIIAIIFVLVAAYKYLTSAGEAERVRGAKHTLIFAVVAVTLAILSKGLPFVISNFFLTSVDTLHYIQDECR